MTNHPNRSNADFRFIAFSTVTGTSQAHAASARVALALAAEGLSDTDFLEVLDCEENGRKVWTGGTTPRNPIPLHKARALHSTVFRGAGYAEHPTDAFPAIALTD
ncbi:MAG: hypothetical protein WDN04_13365 [Rhodospirillales bacterium]